MPEPDPWPASAAWDDAGLRLGAVSAADLAGRFGTPLLVFDTAEIRGRMRRILAAFPRAAYAVKAFGSHAIVRLAAEEGLDLLCASGGEVELCLRAAVPARRIHLHGNAKTDAELELACASGLGLVIANSLSELVRLDRIASAAGIEVDALLRVTPGVHTATHEKIATGHEESKFGVARGEAAAAVAAAAGLASVRLRGLHAHAGSQVLDPAPWLASLDVLVEVARGAGFEPAILDVGGGFGVTYTDEPSIAPEDLAVALGERLDALATAAGWRTPELRVEPGRWIVANAGCTIYRVLGRTTAGDRELLAVDGGMSDNLRPMLYDARHAVAAAGQIDGAPTRSFTVVGRHCESGDVLAGGVDLPTGTGPGDLVAVAGTGAYAYPLASVYNRFGRPAVVAVEAGAATTWLRREDPGDLDRLEVARPADASLSATPDGIEVRPARPADARAFLEHWEEVVGEGGYLRSERPDARPAQVRRRFRGSWSAEEANVLAVHGRDVVGSIGLARERHPATRHVATLGMAVSPGHRRRGVGAALLAAGFRWAREQGVAKLVLWVFPDNVGAIALYRRFGFVEEGRLARHARTAAGPRDEILMAAWIEGDP